MNPYPYKNKRKVGIVIMADNESKENNAIIKLMQAVDKIAAETNVRISIKAFDNSKQRLLVNTSDD